MLQRGQGSEFDSLREYVVGDDVRSIDWRATARASDVMVRTWRPERDRHVLIVLDCGRTSAGRVGDAPRLDASIEATLLLTALAERAGDRVDVLAWDRAVRGAVQGTPEASPGAHHLDAGATSKPAFSRPTGRDLRIEIARRAGSVHSWCCSPSLDPAPVRRAAAGHSAADTSSPGRGRCRQRPVGHRRCCTPAQTCRPPTVPLLPLGSPPNVAPWRTELVHRGVEVVDALPDDLAPALADRYLALKAAGRL